MATDNESETPATEKIGREQSTIQFPYMDLEEAIKVARVMHERAGGVPMERDQVAAALNNSGGTLANKLSAAKQFGLIDTIQGKWSVTALGYDALDPARERAAKAEAFLKVELYKKTYEEYRGKILPGKAGLEHAFRTFGVAPKQADKARQTFERSARSAGFFPSPAEDRLVMPVIGNIAASPAEPDTPAPVQSSAPAPEPPPASVPVRIARTLDPFVEGLLERLPASLPLPDKATWPVADRAKWLQAAAQIFDLIYERGENDTGEVAVSVRRGSD